MNCRHVVLVCAVLALGFFSPACGKFDPVVPTAPELSGPAPELDGTWDFTMDRGALPPCVGVFTIDGSLGSGTFTACGSLAGTVQGSADPAGAVVIVFTPTGLLQFWTRGKFYGPANISGFIYGEGWNGQQNLTAVRR